MPLNFKDDEELYDYILSFRGIDRAFDTVCVRCCGSGLAIYGNTSTWRSGNSRSSMSGQAITKDICDRCWGSGVENRKGTDLRLIDNKIKKLEGFIAENTDVDLLNPHEKPLYEEIHKRYFPKNYFPEKKV